MVNTVTNPGKRLAGLLADLMSKLAAESISEDELALFLKKQNPFEKPTFDPEKFFGKGWRLDSMLSQLKVGVINGDATKASTLFVSEKTLKGEDRLDRLSNSGRKHLGAEDFWFFWNNRHLIPKDWKGKVVTFDANILLGPDGSRYVLLLFHSGSKWNWNYNWLISIFGSDCVSAVLAE